MEKKTIRSSVEILADIDRLKQELKQALIAEKKAGYSELPKVVYIWDMYLNEEDRGNWTSAEIYNGLYSGAVFETEEEAYDAGLTHLRELEDEGELTYEDEDGEAYEAEPEDYTIDTVAISVKDVDEETLADSGLEHLI
jgi:hypothetical protein